MSKMVSCTNSCISCRTFEKIFPFCRKKQHPTGKYWHSAGFQKSQMVSCRKSQHSLGKNLAFCPKKMPFCRIFKNFLSYHPAGFFDHTVKINSIGSNVQQKISSKLYAEELETQTLGIGLKLKSQALNLYLRFRSQGLGLCLRLRSQVQPSG